MGSTKSIVEDAALEWFGELGYTVGHGPQLAPGEPAAESASPALVILVPPNASLDEPAPIA